MCICDIVCHCPFVAHSSDSPLVSVALATVKDASIGACLLGKTRPVISPVITDDKLSLFNISNEYKTYSYTLSPKGVGIMACKSRDRQYETLKRLHEEVLSNFECSYIITIEIYPNSDNDLHCHGLIRFRSHKKKEEFKKLLKDKITLFKKGTYKNLIDCEFINSYASWSSYIMKSQEALLSNTEYYPFVKIDYSFHQVKEALNIIPIPTSNKTRLKKTKSLEAELIKAQLKVNNLLNQISILKNI